MWMALHALAQCTARLLFAHQQKQGCQRAGISSRDGEEGGYACGLERVLRACGPRNGGAGKGRLVRLRLRLCICPARPPVSIQLFYAHAFASLLLSRLHGVEPDRATWQAARSASTQAFVAPDTVQQKKLAKLLKRPLPEGGRGRVIHVRKVPSRPRMHES